ncbi:NACHT domain-containing protein [Micromonospora trifolii]|uniref:NACHT domain-containing protein n=1 Tax=Micromonospora trifolii TaxID=2911208 RepID=UPI003D2EF28D
MSEIGPHSYRGVVQILLRLLQPSLDRRRIQLNADRALQVPGGGAVGDIIDTLSSEQLSGLHDYLMSPDLDYVAHQFYAARSLEQRGKNSEELLSACRQQLRSGIRNRLDLKDDSLFEVAELIFSTVLVATQTAWNQANGSILHSTLDFAIAGRLTAAAVRNADLLSKIDHLSQLHAFENELRSQIASLHAEMRLPHAGTSRAVPYSQLYVQPILCHIDEIDNLKRERSASRIRDSTVQIADCLAPGGRLVILGAPGAGKSTLVSKLSHDLVTNSDPTLPQLTPLILILRDIVDGLTRGGSSIVDYIVDRCKDPYNIEPPENAIEYLLLNGRAVVIFDGLDELVDTSLRTKAVRLIEGFVSRYPLTPILITSRRVGYDAAPLNESVVTVAILSDFDEEQVEQYASNWFRLDDSIPAGDRFALKDSFIRDSAMVRDLRVNPLMLSLLCSMYATERYIPRNRPDIFEKCATMLFERWDRMRGIESGVPFGAHIRSAVQHLAWELFTKQKYGGAMPRRELIEKLAAEFFGKRHQDLDLARDEAERFLDFCTGRAWVLTDVGATETEPRYGFVHRTFLEFFTAEHLIRTRESSPRRVLQALGRRLEREEWEIVAQLALQILERNVSSGADKFFAALADRAAQAPQPQSASLLSFVVRSEPFVTLSVATAQKLLKIMIEHELQIHDSFRYWNDFQAWAARISRAPEAFSGTFEFIDQVSAENSPVIARALANELSERVADLADEDIAGAAYLYHAACLSESQDVRSAVSGLDLAAYPLVQRYVDSSPGIGYYQVLASKDAPAVQLESALTRLGGTVLFQSPRASVFRSAYTSISEQLLSESKSRFTSDDNVLFAIDRFLGRLDSRPWFLISENEPSLLSIDLRYGKENDMTPMQQSLRLAILAPYVEIGLLSKRPFDVPDWHRLVIARTGSDPSVIKGILGANAAQAVGVTAFLEAWAAGELNTVAYSGGARIPLQSQEPAIPSAVNPL